MFTEFYFEPKSFISSNNFIEESVDEFDITRDPFIQIQSYNSSIFDNMNFFPKNENTFCAFELSKDDIKEKNLIKNFNYSQKKLSGKKRKNSFDVKGKFHTKNQNDNILRKINVHFLNFIIDFMNEVLNKCNNINSKNINDKFYEINGKYKKKLIKKILMILVIKLLMKYYLLKIVINI